MECAMEAHVSKAEYEGILSLPRLFKYLGRNMQDSFSDVKALKTTLFSKDSGGSRQSASDAAQDGKCRAAAAKCKVETVNELLRCATL